MLNTTHRVELPPKPDYEQLSNGDEKEKIDDSLQTALDHAEEFDDEFLATVLQNLLGAHRIDMSRNRDK